MTQRPSRVEIVVDPGSLVRGERGTVSGSLWLRHVEGGDEAGFPEAGWSDSPLSALATWLPELQRLAREAPGEARLAFMDGPYHFSVRAEQDGAWSIRGAEERAGARGSRGPQWRADGRAFLESAVRAARAVLAHCDARGWWSADTETLRRTLEGATIG